MLNVLQKLLCTVRLFKKGRNPGTLTPTRHYLSDIINGVAALTLIARS